MSKFLIRNDDVAYDTDINEIKKFCEICDKYGYKIIQAITLIGECRKSRVFMDNHQIKRSSFKKFQENQEVLDFLRSRNDLIAVHGLWHTHEPTVPEIKTAKKILQNLDLYPTHFAPPFNEGNYGDEVAGLEVINLSQEKGHRLEDYLKKGDPQSPTVYLHSWRFNNINYTFEMLENCLNRLSPKIKKLSSDPVSAPRIWYNDWIKENAVGKILDIGKSNHWDYGFATIDINANLNPTYVGDVQKMDFPNESFDTVLCNGMYEFVDNPQKMIDECLRITKKEGTTIFGFVGRDYAPYKKNWKFFNGDEILPTHERIDFRNNYHFLVCKK